jgi:Mg2+-importing ATPase
MRIMVLMLLLVLGGNMLLGRAPVETLLFSIALAVGLSPELLPAILSVNLARAAQMMARHGVLVRRLNAIENLGSMNVLCTDKTGTLTEGVVRLEGAYDGSGTRSSDVMALAAWNAALQTGFSNPLDEAILREGRPRSTEIRKIGEIPYDFVRKRLSVIVCGPTGVRLITKGAFEHVLQACTRTQEGGPLTAAQRADLEQRFRAWSSQGIRVLAVATRSMSIPATAARWSMIWSSRDS